MIESPLFQELMDQTRRETRQADILQLLAARFGPVPPEVTAQVQAVLDEQQLWDLNIRAGTCPNLESFRAQLLA